jgi:hypothetical protein
VASRCCALMYVPQIMKLQAIGVLRSKAVFSLTSTTIDLDEKFTKRLEALDLDVSGGLIELMTARGVSALASTHGNALLTLTITDLLIAALAPYKDFAGDWSARANVDGEGRQPLHYAASRRSPYPLPADWILLSAVLRASVELLNHLSSLAMERLCADEAANLLPPLEVDEQSPAYVRYPDCASEALTSEPPSVAPYTNHSRSG